MGPIRAANEFLRTKKQYDYDIISKIYGGGGGRPPVRNPALPHPPP